MTTLFVTSSGTDVGKTAVCCRLLEELPKRAAVRCIKPVVTGFDPAAIERSDPARLLAARGLPADETSIEATSPWRFRAALSPDMAAARESKTVPFDALVTYCREPRGPRLNLIEGIGGVMTPLDARHTVLDLIAALAAPTWLVVGSYLGSLSHTLTALEALRARTVPVAALIVVQSLEEPVPTAETAATLERFIGDIPIAILPRNAPRAPILSPLLSGTAADLSLA
jgi:dethiobiotin synthetase